MLFQNSLNISSHYQVIVIDISYRVAEKHVLTALNYTEIILSIFSLLKKHPNAHHCVSLTIMYYNFFRVPLT